MRPYLPSPMQGAIQEVGYRWLFEQSLDGILLTTPEGAILAANPAICQMLGYTEGELRALGRMGVVDLDDPRLPAALEERRQTGRFVGELTLIAKGGHRVPVEISSQVVTDESGGKLTSMHIRDISQRLRAEERLRLSEERFRVALRSSPITVSMVDTDLRYTWIYNPHPSFQAESVIGKRDVDLSPAEHVIELVAVKRQVLETGRGVRREVRIRVGDGDRFYDVTAEPLHDAAGAVSGVTVAAADITERKHAEQQQRFLAKAGEILAESLDYKSTLDRIARLAVPILGDACILDVNEGTDMLAVAHVDPAVEPAIRAMRERFPPAPDGPHPMAVVRRTREPMLMPSLSDEFLDSISTAPELRRSFAELHVRSALVVPLIAGGRVLGVLTSFSTKRALGETDVALAMELARRAALAIDNACAYSVARKASKTRDEVLGIVSHDLRNAIGTITMSAELLEAGLDAEGMQRLADKIARSTRWMTHIINDLLDVTALEAGRLSVQPERTTASAIAETVRTVCEARAQERGVELRVELTPVPPFHGDANRLVQAVGNLVENAIKFTPSGGVVILTVEPRDGGVAFRVTDTGPGIAAEDLPHVFDRFWQAQKTRHGGAGLGLAIARGIAEAHGGRIDVTSEPGRGSTFELVLPRG
ncbi:MAG TPA: PAS domain-containing sensor histidine kinase [Gemmatimonadaceae bacterium]|nr:PAS domain-containing sensor histidine kinase [Gemmatimonadaceae bacterium]